MWNVVLRCHFLQRAPTSQDEDLCLPDKEGLAGNLHLWMCHLNSVCPPVNHWAPSFDAQWTTARTTAAPMWHFSNTFTLHSANFVRSNVLVGPVWVPQPDASAEWKHDWNVGQTSARCDTGITCWLVCARTLTRIKRDRLEPGRKKLAVCPCRSLPGLFGLFFFVQHVWQHLRNAIWAGRGHSVYWRWLIRHYGRFCTTYCC